MALPLVAAVLAWTLMQATPVISPLVVHPVSFQFSLLLLPVGTLLQVLPGPCLPWVSCGIKIPLPSLHLWFRPLLVWMCLSG